MIRIHNSMVCLRVHYCVQLLPEVMFFFNHFLLLFLCYSIFLWFSQLGFFIYISQKCSIAQNIWCLMKTQLRNITQTIFQGGSPWATLIHNSVVCLGVHYCAQLLPEVMFFFQTFPVPFPLLKFVSLLLSFILLGIKTEGFPKDWFQPGKKTWMIRIHNSMVCLRVHYCVQLLSGGHDFFQSFPLPFPLLKYFSFIFSIGIFIENSQKCLISQNIWCLIKTN